MSKVTFETDVSFDGAMYFPVVKADGEILLAPAGISSSVMQVAHMAADLLLEQIVTSMKTIQWKEPPPHVIAALRAYEAKHGGHGDA